MKEELEFSVYLNPKLMILSTITNLLFMIHKSCLYIYLNYRLIWIESLNLWVTEDILRTQFIWKKLRDLVGIARLEPHVVVLNLAFYQSTRPLLG